MTAVRLADAFWAVVFISERKNIRTTFFELKFKKMWSFFRVGKVSIKEIRKLDSEISDNANAPATE